jgi:hypothetical protein
MHTYRETLRDQYERQPEPFWHIAHYSGHDGYDVMDFASVRGWRPVASWGADGWDLGSWPLVVMYTRTNQDRWEYVEYIEGDVTAFRFPDQKTRDTVIDGAAFWHWKNAESSWTVSYRTVDQAPPRLRGPYGTERERAPQLVRALVSPAGDAPEVWYLHPELAALQAIVGGPIQLVTLAADAHLYCHDEGKLNGLSINQAATDLWYAEQPQMAGLDILVGDVVILGGTGDAEADCPDRFIPPDSTASD